MPSASVTNTFTSSTTAVASEVNQNFTDLLTLLNTTKLDADNIQALAITTALLAAGSVTAAKIAADAVDGTKVADDSIDSEHLAAGGIDTEHIADNQVTEDKLADSIVSKLATPVVGSVAVPGSTGASATSGLGIAPRLVLFFTMQANSTTYASFGLGGTDGTNEFHLVNRTDGASVYRAAGTDACIAHPNPSSGSKNILAAITSLDADGFTVNYSAVATGTVYYIAIP